MFKLPKKLTRNNIIQLLVLSGLVGLVVYFIHRMMKTENYSALSSFYDESSKYVSSQGLYKDNVGAIATRKDFSNMAKPLLNLIFVPLIKGETE